MKCFIQGVLKLQSLDQCQMMINFSSLCNKKLLKQDKCDHLFNKLNMRLKGLTFILRKIKFTENLIRLFFFFKKDVQMTKSHMKRCAIYSLQLHQR